MQIRNDIENSKFVTQVNGVEAKLKYARGPAQSYDLVHTIVPPEAEGQGVASELVKFAIATAKKENVKVIATCSYVKRWFEKHPEEKSILLN